MQESDVRNQDFVAQNILYLYRCGIVELMNKKVLSWRNEFYKVKNLKIQYMY